MNRRSVLEGLGSVVAAAGVARRASAERKPGQPATQPNIVVVQLDDMRATDWPVFRRTRKMLKGSAFFPNYMV
ncbi:MAG: hypothetical protein ACR2J8_10220, partial [Thermomicrobiales bacterium]